MKSSANAKRDYRRWSIELDALLVRFVLLVVFMLVVPDAAVATAEALAVITK